VEAADVRALALYKPPPPKKEKKKDFFLSKRFEKDCLLALPQNRARLLVGY
jgi:hypothetical protein